MTPDGPTMLGDGRYQLSGLLGRGGMAEVRMAQDLRLGRHVAIKRLRTDLARDPTFQARFRREAQSAASLNHPAIVAVYDTGEEQSPDDSSLVLPYIVMEYVEGRTLRDILREGRKILPERALEITASILDALDYSHRAGIIHRDIKPANVMLNPTGDVKVMDFGIARATSDSSATMTQTAAVIGTAQYLSPEQARGEQVDARSDLYSTGCVLFELLTGRPPFIGDSPVSVAYQHVREEPPAPSTIDPEVSPAIDAITMKALAKPVEERYQSAGEMRADIARALEGRAVLAPAVYASSGLETQPFLAPETRREPQGSRATAITRYDEPQRASRRTGLWIALALLLAALVVAGLVIVPKLLSKDAVAQVRVPTLLNLTVPQATAKLDAAGLTLGAQVPKNSPTVPKGHVLSQSVPPGKEVDKGGSVDVTVSAGTQVRVVPDVSSLSLAAATSKLQGLGFKVDPQPQSDSTERKNQVTTTDPLPGNTEPVGATIKVFYSTGYVVVDSVVGMDVGAATTLLKSHHFSVVRSAVQSDAPAGTVTKQNPPGGSREPYGATVVISVSLGPQTTAPTSTPSPTTTPPPTTSAPPTTTTPPTRPTGPSTGGPSSSLLP
jgi:eukaryotic-like serine/threonine-protein kinase